MWTPTFQPRLPPPHSIVCSSTVRTIAIPILSSRCPIVEFSVWDIVTHGWDFLRMYAFVCLWTCSCWRSSHQFSLGVTKMDQSVIRSIVLNLFSSVPTLHLCCSEKRTYVLFHMFWLSTKLRDFQQRGNDYICSCFGIGLFRLLHVVAAMFTPQCLLN